MEVLERGAKGFEYTDDQKELRRTLRQFAEKEIVPNAAAWDEKEQFPAEVIRKLGELGFLGVIFPERYGWVGIPYMIKAINGEEVPENLFVPLVAVTGETIGDYYELSC